MIFLLIIKKLTIKYMYHIRKIRFYYILLRKTLFTGKLYNLRKIEKKVPWYRIISYHNYRTNHKKIIRFYNEKLMR